MSAILIPIPGRELLAIAQEYADAGRLDAAERLLGHILRAVPAHAGALHLRGLLAFRRGRAGEAADLIRQAMAAGAAPATCWRNLGEILRVQARLDEALAAARQAVSLDPADQGGLLNLAMVHYDRMEIPACVAAARAVLDLNPHQPAAHMKLAQALLLQGDFAAGWGEYEWRWCIPGAPAPLPAALAGLGRPLWNGAALPPGRTLLLVADQGFGDGLMFARYIPWALARTPRAVLAASPELRPLLAANLPGLEVAANWADLPGFDAWCPLSSLPLLHGTTASSIPCDIPYLRAEPGRVAQWRARLDAICPPGARRVGLAWAGRPSHPNDASRSAPLAALAPLAAVPGVAFVSLQLAPPGDVWPGPAPLLDVSAHLASFADTAALLEALDLVVSVDTAAAHLAGALGRPTWLMLPFAPDWRWQIGRADSPWYLTLRLFRAAAPRDWAGLAGQVAESLHQGVAQHQTMQPSLAQASLVP